MARAKIIYQEKQEVYGRHLRSKLWIIYSGKLTIYDRKTNPIILNLVSEIDDSLMYEYMDEKREFKGDTVSSVYGKVAKWYQKNGIVFQN